MHIDIRVLEHLSSKICHDLISPVSAINNGVELIEDIGESVADEAMKLIGDSAVTSSRRLKMFRIAYGRAGSEANLPVRDVAPVIEQYFTGGKIKLKWPNNEELADFAEQRGGIKVLINALILSEEILAYGGEIGLHRLSEDGTIGCRIEVLGKAAQMAAPMAEALSGEVAIEDLTPRTIQAYVTGRFAAHFGIGIHAATPRDEALDLMLSAKTDEYDKHQSS